MCKGNWLFNASASTVKQDAEWSRNEDVTDDREHINCDLHGLLDDGKWSSYEDSCRDANR